MKKILSFLLIWFLAYPSIAQKKNSGAMILRGGVVKPGDISGYGFASMSVLANIKGLGVGATFGLEDNKVVNGAMMPAGLEITSIGEESKLAPMFSLQVGWLLGGKKDRNNTVVTETFGGFMTRFLVGVKFPMKDSKRYPFIQIGYGRQGYETIVRSSGRTIEEKFFTNNFIGLIGFKF